VYEAPSHHPIHYYGKEETLDNTPSSRKHCHKKKGTEDMVVLVMHVLKIFLVDSVIHNSPPCI
jgi:hypothetical protein